MRILFWSSAISFFSSDCTELCWLVWHLSNSSMPCEHIRWLVECCFVYALSTTWTRTPSSISCTHKHTHPPPPPHTHTHTHSFGNMLCTNTYSFVHTTLHRQMYSSVYTLCTNTYSFVHTTLHSQRYSFVHTLRTYTYSFVHSTLHIQTYFLWLYTVHKHVLCLYYPAHRLWYVLIRQYPAQIMIVLNRQYPAQRLWYALNLLYPSY